MYNRLFLLLGVLAGSISAVAIFGLMIGLSWWMLNLVVFSQPST